MCSECQEETDDGRQDLSSLSGLLFVRGELPQHERGGATSAQFSDAVQTYPPRCPCPEECEEDGCIGHCCDPVQKHKLKLFSSMISEQNSG